eukprot:Skav205960  [mRNA]  locus=scaffold442:317841:322600:+ [translate_table: standard]
MLFLQRLLALCWLISADGFGGHAAKAPPARCEDGPHGTCEVYPEAVPQHTLVQKATATRRAVVELAEDDDDP